VPELPREGSRRSADARVEEAEGLAEAIGIDVVAARPFRVRSPRPATLLGKGQVEEIAGIAKEQRAGLLVVDAALTPIQQKNLEDEVGAKVIDRTGLILEIFGERAATAEGRLQVELAHLDYQAGRLVRSWTHLERQRGGFGFLGGPGETQIEADRRLIRDRMAKIRRELDQVKRTRTLHRDRRQRAPWPVIALVGYTNAGKSTLFNRVTGETVFAENLLFATLDPTMRDIRLPGFDKVILSDTVGFVSDLPTELSLHSVRPSRKSRLPTCSSTFGTWPIPIARRRAKMSRMYSHRWGLRTKAARRGSRPGTRSIWFRLTNVTGSMRNQSVAMTPCRSRQ